MKLDSSISAIVTGGASGLGGATVRALRAHGVKVAIFDMNEKTGVPFAAETGSVYCNVNVTNEASVDAGFAQARAANGQERILVNCAGTGNAFKTAGRNKETGEIKSFPLEQFDRIIQINLVGTFRCIAKSAAGMLTLDVLPDGDRGAIVNTASVAAEDGQIGQAAYSASKGGVIGMTLPIARDLSAVGIRVNTVAPGLIDTPIYGEGEASEQFKENLQKGVLFPKRLGEPEQLASMVIECVTNSYMNAETIRVDGGIRMPPK